MRVLVTVLLLLGGAGALGQIQVSSPKDNTWLPPLDEDRQLEIKGKVLNPSPNTKVVLSLDKQRSEKNETWTTTVNKSGEFSFRISQFLILTRQKTQMKLEAFNEKGRAAYQFTNQSIYCCSIGNYGYFGLLVPGKSREIEIIAANTPIDKTTVSIPKSNIAENSFIMVTGEAVQGIPLEKYVPLSAAIKFYLAKSKDLSDLKYSLIAYPDIPREDTTREISTEDWNTVTNKNWKAIDLNMSKVLVLGLAHPGGEWVEIVPDKIIGNRVFFSQPKEGRSLSIFVVVAKP